MIRDYCIIYIYTYSYLCDPYALAIACFHSKCHRCLGIVCQPDSWMFAACVFPFSDDLGPRESLLIPPSINQDGVLSHNLSTCLHFFTNFEQVFGGSRSRSILFPNCLVRPSIFSQDRGKYTYANGDEFMGLWTRATNWAAPSTTGFGLPRASKLGWGWSYLVGVFFVFEILFSHIWSLVFLAELKPPIIKTKTIWEDDWTTMTFAGSSQQHVDAMQFFFQCSIFWGALYFNKNARMIRKSPQMLGDSAGPKNRRPSRTQHGSLDNSIQFPV